MDKKNIETIYPLSSMQQALLLHSLQMGNADLGFLHLHCTLKGEFQRAYFEQAWQQVMRRHAMLRTSVHWEDLEQPLQVVHGVIDQGWTYLDWQGHTTEQQQGKLKDLLAVDRERGFDFTKAPVMRTALIQLDTETYTFVWSCHHLLLDGWSGAIVLKEAFRHYEALCAGKAVQLSPARSYRDYVTWLQEQDGAEAEAYWKEALQGFTMPTPIPVAPAQKRVASFSQQHQKLVLAEGTIAALQAFVQRYRLTLGTLIQGVWALLMGRFAAMDDVVFGATVSGRPPTMVGVESIVGLFINTLPIRVRFSHDEPVLTVLQHLQQDQMAASLHQYVSQGQIQAQSEVPGVLPLFESLVVLENYPWEEASARGASGLSLHDLQGGITSNFPLTLVVKPGSSLTVEIQYDGSRAEAATIALLLRLVEKLVEAICTDPTKPVEHYLGLVDEVKTLRSSNATSVAASVGSNGQPLDANKEAPRTPLQAQLLPLWEEVLGVTPIGVQDDFFDLGGTSLLAVRLVETIENKLQRKVPLAVLLQASTIAEMATLLGGEALPWDSLVALQTGGSRPPLYCVHAGHGNVLFYRELARYLGPDQPFYALQAAGLNGERPPFNRVEDMAAHYLREIRSLQPAGPYYLAGHCFGSKVALEMACQLHDAGEKVGLLAVLDSQPPWQKSDEAIQEKQSSKTLGHYVRRGIHHLFRGKLFGIVKNMAQKRIGAMLEPQARLQLEVEQGLRIAGHAFKARVYPGPITLFLSNDTLHNPEKAWYIEGWEAFSTQDAIVHSVTGQHTTILVEPHVELLAERITQSLKQGVGVEQKA